MCERVEGVLIRGGGRMKSRTIITRIRMPHPRQIALYSRLIPERRHWHVRGFVADDMLDERRDRARE
jgi:hypothetical protein